MKIQKKLQMLMIYLLIWTKNSTIETVPLSQNYIQRNFI
jgi:hypothetical protein